MIRIKKFNENEEKVDTLERIAKSISEYSSEIWQNFKRFEHLFFRVEVEYNLTSFNLHDKTKELVLLSKYIFCENKSNEYYKSKFGVNIPVIGIGEL